MTRSAQRLKGASRKVRHYRIAPPRGFSGSSKAASEKSSRCLSNTQQKALEEESKERMQLMLSALSPEDRQLIAGADPNNLPMEDRLGIEGEENLIAFDPDDDWEDLPLVMQGDEAFVHAIRDVVHVRWQDRRSKPKRLWRQRIQHLHAEWDILLPLLTDAYLQWRTHAAQQTRRDVSRPSHPSAQAAPNNDPSNPVGEAAPAASADNQPPGPVYWLQVELFDIFTLETSLTLSRSPDSTSPAIDLMVNGYIARSPVNTKTAVSIGTLELFHRIRLRKASFSVEAFAKVVCDYYQIPYRNHYRAIFADTYDIFLLVLRRVELRVFEALGWADKDWRAKNACRACCYKLENEPNLRYSRLYAFDGNNSLKRMRLREGRTAGDTRVLADSDYFLNPDFVDRYANEVRGQKQPNPHPEQDDQSEDDADNNESVEGDPTDGLHADTVPDRSDQDPGALPFSQSGTLAQKLLASCVTNWKANSSEEKKKMWAIFDEAGVFVAACRHGMILWIIDMIRSGELAKYPLAIVAKILETMEPRTLGGYDIGCSFESTVKRSSIGGPFDANGSRICVNAFHGYTHCYPCQLTYHPNVIEGSGLEDFETLERVFSGSNHLASITRHASSFRRRLYIEAYFKQWDEDKHSNLGTFILNNYMQALQILDQDVDALRQLMESQQISEEMMTQWEHEEHHFFSTLGQGEPYDVRKVVYVELLQELRDLDSKRTQAGIRILTFTPDCPDIMNYHRLAAGTSREEAERRRADEKYDRVLLEVCSLEVALGISRGERWTPATKEYQDTLQYIRERKYRQVLDKLQRLVIQRLFELHKLNLAQTGYKLRTHLSKSLQTRCKTIRKAVNDYNAAAATLTPPRPPLDWSQVTHYHFLEEFNLLQDTRNDIREKRWGEPAVREAMKLRRRIARAHEEIVRCNVEVRRLHTAIRDEGRLFATTLERLAGSPLYIPLKDFVTRRSRINRQILRRVHQIYDLPGFTGSKDPGVRVGLGIVPEVIADPPAEAERNQNDDDDDDDDDDDEDEVQANIGGLIQFVAQL